MFKLHPHQQIIFDKLKYNLSIGNNRILLAACTGLGKSVIAHEIIKSANDKGNSVLFTSHRIDLAKQTKKVFKDLNPDYLQGRNNDFNEDFLCLVATLQTLQKHTIKPPKVIIIDEVHYAYESKLVQDLFIKYPKAIFIGLSATPVDNNDCLLDNFDCVIDDYQTEDLIKLGFLVPFKCYAPITIDVSQVKKSMNDFDSNDLEATINKDDVNQSIVDNYKIYALNRKFIVFASNKKHCISLNDKFKENGISTEIITADVSEKKREQILFDFKNGIIQGLISIEILTAGFDEQSLSCVIFATATMQWKKYIQCAGRGIRLFGNSFSESVANGKSDCVLLDFFGNIARHDLPNKRKMFKQKTRFSKIIDRQLGIEETSRIFKEVTVEKQVYLKKIGSLLDLYDGKVYRLESDLQDDVNNYLKKTAFYGWRQNSGKMFKEGRWIHFSSKNGLPDNTVFYKNSSIFFGLELKLRSGSLTAYQKQTLPEFIANNVLFFICESVYDVYLSILHIENNIIDNDNYVILDKNIYNLPEWQVNLRTKLF